MVFLRCTVEINKAPYFPAVTMFDSNMLSFAIRNTIFEFEALEQKLSANFKLESHRNATQKKEQNTHRNQFDCAYYYLFWCQLLTLLLLLLCNMAAAFLFAVCLCCCGLRC